MKSEFPEYYYDFQAMWNEAIFVFDANVLLNVYRFSPSASKDLLQILEWLKERIWIPYQFAYEYHKNLHLVDKNIETKYQKTKGEIEKIRAKTVESLQGLSNPTSFSVTPQQYKAVENALGEISEQLSGLENEHRSRLQDANIRSIIAELFAGKVGDQSSLSRRKDIYARGKERYEDRISPGYKDKDRNKANPYGDFVGWCQVIDFAQSEDKPIIMITDDSTGDDWFHKPGGEAQGPRRELVDEMREKANVNFYLYQTWELLKLANKYLPDLGEPVTDRTIEEAKRQSETRLRQRLREQQALEASRRRPERTRSDDRIAHSRISRHRSPSDDSYDDDGIELIFSREEDIPASEFYRQSQEAEYGHDSNVEEWPGAPATVDDIPF